MFDATTNLLLPDLLASQAQKHITHNEALRLPDGLVQVAVIDRDLAAPPVSPADGDRYIVDSGATGDWIGWELNLVLHVGGVWTRLAPRPGSRARIDDEGLVLVWAGLVRASILPTGRQNLSLLGLGTATDTSNPFSAK